MKETRHWFLRLDKHQQWLGEWINTGVADGRQLHNPADWKNHVLGQCNSWLADGLNPRAMTRDLEWGVDVPQEIPGSEGKKLYVWLETLITLLVVHILRVPVESLSSSVRVLIRIII
jgi:methionyl-tRNA synthetase